MEVQGGETRCLSDSVRTGEDTKFSYKAVTNKGDGPSKVKVTIANPDGKLHHDTLTTEYGHHLIPKGGGGGKYRVCFQNSGQKKTSTRVALMETTVPSEERVEPKMARHLEPVEVLLYHAKEVSKSINLQLSEGTDFEMERISDENVLRSRINKVAAFTILVLLSVSAWQLALLNRFFRSKKLI